MSVRRFRSVEEMKAARPVLSGPALWKHLAELWELGERTRRAPPPPPGVYKHRSIEEAKALKDKWQRG